MAEYDFEYDLDKEKAPWKKIILKHIIDMKKN